jgi:endoglucanase
MSTPPGRFDGYVHAHAGRLVDGTGAPLQMRGVGLGNWLLPEGYMWKFDGGPQSPREIEAMITDLVGPDSAAAFWRAFQDSFITEADIERIAAEGFDHVRLPINSRVIMDSDGVILARGLELIDRTIDWCRAHGLWVVLDLHGAPGGQTGTNIDDSPRGRPELFENDTYRAQTVALWRFLAQRYATETVVAGYDLLNEPLPNQWQDLYADRLVAVYREITAAIREVDADHLIIYEGTHWANNWSIFTEVWDPNSMLQFHKYWSAPDRPSIEGFLATGRRLGLPIYMGEGGENNLDWLQTAFQLWDDLDISWNFWPWKKIDTRTSPCSIVPPAGWAAITAYAAKTGPRPTIQQAQDVLDQLIIAMTLPACDYQPQITNSLLRRAPLRLPATGFGFRGAGISYGVAGGVPLRGFRADDAVTLQFAGGDEPEDLPFAHNTGTARAKDEGFAVVLQPGDWVAYELNLATGSERRLALSGTAAATPTLLIDGGHVPWQLDDAPGADWRTAIVKLGAGRHEFRVGASTSVLTFASIQVH